MTSGKWMIKLIDGKFSMEPLDYSMSNVDAYRLGKIALEVNRSKHIGDEIDRGLVLRRVLEEQGYYLIKKD